jgi:hypothetical protein
VLDQNEKQGGRLVASSSFCPFKQFIDHFGLMDLGFAGNPFTCCNNRQGHASIKERLDRGLASLSWIHLHLEYSILHIPFCSIRIITLLFYQDPLDLKNFGLKTSPVV